MKSLANSTCLSTSEERILLHFVRLLVFYLSGAFCRNKLKPPFFAVFQTLYSCKLLIVNIYKSVVLFQCFVNEANCSLSEYMTAEYPFVCVCVCVCVCVGVGVGVGESVCVSHS